MTPWQWWAAPYDHVEYEGVWSLGPFATREEAIVAGMRETPLGEDFYVIEARSSAAMKYEDAEIVPFLRSRNRELLTNGPSATAGGEG